VRILAPLKTTGQQRISSFRAGERKMPAQGRGSTVVHSHLEMDSHADTLVCSSNSVIMHYTGKECDLSCRTQKCTRQLKVSQLYRLQYDNTETEETTILIRNEAIWMGGQMEPTLVNPNNPNQLQAYGITVHDNPFDPAPIFISTKDNKFTPTLLQQRNRHRRHD
jgi:hypothetical protein